MSLFKNTIPSNEKKNNSHTDNFKITPSIFLSNVYVSVAESSRLTLEKLSRGAMKPIKSLTIERTM